MQTELAECGIEGTKRKLPNEGNMQKLMFVTVAVVFNCGSIFADDNVHQLAQDNSAFAFDLYDQLSGTEGNLFFSPYSVSTALAMTYGGARGETESQMAKTLH